MQKQIKACQLGSLTRQEADRKDRPIIEVLALHTLGPEFNTQDLYFKKPIMGVHSCTPELEQ